ncbi:MAG: pilus assembly protein PilM [Candidatus Omnitrophica bacterium]|nr:pilus assembly protein PilM [Candidatus Omnitrophota bacterium]
MRGFNKTQLGINLSADAITLVESSARKIVKYCRQELSEFSVNLMELSEDEIKFSAILQKILRENEFTGRDVYVGLPAHDIIVRSFQIPLVSKREIDSTINYEARKYLPFRIEELIFDFLTRRNKRSKGFNVIFAAIKKKAVERYVKVLNQVGFNIVSLEPASLSFLRAAFVKTRINLKKIVLIINIDSRLSEGDILILDSNMPCFIRDLKLSTAGEAPEQDNLESKLNKLINEIRISIDYFRHQQLALQDNISEILLFTDVSETNSWAQAIAQELGISTTAFLAAETLGIDSAHCDLLKAAGASFRGLCNFPVELNLLKKKEEKLIRKESQFAQISKLFVFKPLFKKCLISGGIFIALIIAIYVLGNFKIKKLEKQLNLTRAPKEQLAFLPKAIDFSQKELVAIKKLVQDQLDQVEATIASRVYLTEKIERLQALLPDGVWLEGLDFRKDRGSLEMVLEGVAYLPSGENALVVIDQFLSKLRNDTKFNKGFKDIVLSSVRQSARDDFVIRLFQIKCR